MRKFTFVLILLGLFVYSKAQKPYKINTNEKSSSKIEIQKNSTDEYLIQVSINEYTLKEVSTPKGLQQILSTKEGSQLFYKGMPDLAKLSRSFIVPNDKEMNYELIDSEYIEIKNIEIAPSKGHITRNIDPKTVPFPYGEIYSKNQFYPNTLVQLNDPYIFKDYRGQNLWFTPFQYNPVSKTLRIYTHFSMRYFATEKKVNNQLPNLPKTKTAEFTDIYKNHFVNYPDYKYEPIHDEGKMLIVCYDEFVDEMLPFVQWKRQRGLEVELIKYSEIGSNAYDLKSFVYNQYNEKCLTFLLLVGDAEQIPSLKFSDAEDANYASDNAYGYILGNDAYAEIIVGRFSAENKVQVSTQVKRSIEYERDLTANDEWLSKAVGIASDEGTGGQGDDGESDIQHINNIRLDLMNYGYTQVDQLYDPGAQASSLSNYLNEGRGLINYVGHGSNNSFVTTGFNIMNINMLTNTGKLPFIFSVACVNGDFHGKTCFAEAWLRASNVNQPTGAVAIIASTINQSWQSPMDAQDEMNDLLVKSINGNVKRTFGGITTNGFAHMIDEYGEDGSKMAKTWTVFGDPSLVVRTKTPEIFEASYKKTVPVGMPEIEITTNATHGFASLSKENEIFDKTNITQENINLISSGISLPGKYVLSLFSQDKITLIDTLDFIIPEEAYIVAKSIVLDHETNGNGALDYGENGALKIEFTNVGLQNAGNLIYKLSTASPYINTLSNNENIALGSMTSGETRIDDKQIDFSLSNEIPDQEKLIFDLEITENNNEIWFYKLRTTVNAPKLKIKTLEIDDTLEGNKINGRIDAGETFDLIFTIKNEGHAPISNINATLSMTEANNHLIINNSLIEIEEILPGAEQKIRLNAKAHEDTPLEESVNLLFALNAGFYSVSTEEEIVIGLIPSIIMGSEEEVYTDLARFYDSGETNTYSVSENHTLTIYPETSSNYIHAHFTEFNVEQGYDYLKIYNGNTKDPSQLIGKFDGNKASTIGLQGLVFSSHESGALTFEFFSDTYVNESGWLAAIDSRETTDYKHIFVSVKNEYGALSNAIVNCNGTDYTTNAEGRTLIYASPDQTANIKVSYFGYDDYETSIEVQNESLSIDITLDKNFEVYFIIKDSNGEAIEDVSVSFLEQTKKTNAEGKTEFETLPVINKEYIVSKEGFNSYSATVSVNNKDLNINLTLTNSTGTSVNEEENAKIKVYPNPVNSIAFFNFTDEFLGAELNLYNVIGKSIFVKNVDEKTISIDVSLFPKGIYFYKINKANKQVSGKLIVK